MATDPDVAASDGDHMANVSLGVPEGAQTVTLEDFVLESGEVLKTPTLAFTTHGALNADGTNAVVVGHSLTSSSQVHEWWPQIVGEGPEFALDTTKFFVVCVNYFSSVYGSASPLSIDPGTGTRYAGHFPEIITIRDNVRAQKLVLDTLGVKFCQLAIGGSMGAMVCLEWALMYPEFVGRVASIAGCAFHSDWAIGLGKVERHAIYVDPKWKGGHYDLGDPPTQGLSLARMMAMLSYRTPHSITDRFQRSLQPDGSTTAASSSPPSTASPAAGPATSPTSPPSSLSTDTPASTSSIVPQPSPPIPDSAADSEPMSVPKTAPFFAVESYLNYQGEKFVKRFDPLCYVRLTKTLDTHDIGRGRGDWKTALATISVPTLVVGVASDILYPVVLQEEMSNAIPDSTMSVIDSPHGHDGFLIEISELNETIKKWWVGELRDSRPMSSPAAGDAATAGAGSATETLDTKES